MGLHIGLILLLFISPILLYHKITKAQTAIHPLVCKTELDMCFVQSKDTYSK